MNTENRIDIEKSVKDQLRHYVWRLFGESMALNRQFVNKNYGPYCHLVTNEEVLAYASAIGVKEYTGFVPHLLSAIFELPLIYEILKDPDLHGSQEQVKNNMLMLVHGDQSIKFFKPISAGDKMIFNATISEIEARGSGEVIKISVLSGDTDGNKVVESDWGLFIRGIGIGKVTQKSTNREKVVKESGHVLFHKTFKIPTDITKRYSEAANDMNPIHLDDDMAKSAGLPGIVVHGMCTMAMTVQSIVESFLNGDAFVMESIGVRFSAPVFPADELQVEGWDLNAGNEIGFHVHRKSDGVKVIKGGYITLAP